MIAAGPVAPRPVGVSGARRPGLADVARLAGVSPQSVSRVLRGEPGHAELTRRRVLAAVTSLGYEPDGTAQALALRRAAGPWGPTSVNTGHSSCSDLLLLRHLAQRLPRVHETLADPLLALLQEIVAVCEAVTDACDCTSQTADGWGGTTSAEPRYASPRRTSTCPPTAEPEEHA